MLHFQAAKEELIIIPYSGPPVQTSRAGRAVSHSGNAHIAVPDETQTDTHHPSPNSSISSSSIFDVRKGLHDVCDTEQRSLDNSPKPVDSPARQDNHVFVDIDTIVTEADNVTKMVDGNRLSEVDGDDDDSLCEVERDHWETIFPSTSTRADQSSHPWNGIPESGYRQSRAEEYGGRKLNVSNCAGPVFTTSESTAGAHLRKTTEWATQEWNIRKVTGKPKIDGTTYYLVRWEETWEPEHALGNAKETVDGFEARRRARLTGQVGGRKRHAED